MSNTFDLLLHLRCSPGLGNRERGCQAGRRSWTRGLVEFAAPRVGQRARPICFRIAALCCAFGFLEDLQSLLGLQTYPRGEDNKWVAR